MIVRNFFIQLNNELFCVQPEKGQVQAAAEAVEKARRRAEAKLEGK